MIIVKKYGRSRNYSMIGDWIDLSLQLDESTMPFPGDAPLRIKRLKSIEEDGYFLSELSSSMHIGTHLDFKTHVLKESEDLSFDAFIGRANVIYVTPRQGVVRTKDIEMAYQYIENKESMLLISTNRADMVNTKAYFNYPKFEPAIIEFLNKNKIKLLGADLPSFEYTEGDLLNMHRDCLGQGTYLLENVMQLNCLSSHIELVILPLPIKGLEASLVRPIAKNI